MQKVSELVVNERMSQGTSVKSPKEKKRVPGWCIEELKEKPHIAVEEDTEEMRKWRGLSQSETDRCWKRLRNLTSAWSKKAKEVPFEVEVTPWNG